MKTPDPTKCSCRHVRCCARSFLKFSSFICLFTPLGLYFGRPRPRWRSVPGKSDRVPPVLIVAPAFPVFGAVQLESRDVVLGEIPDNASQIIEQDCRELRAGIHRREN